MKYEQKCERCGMKQVSLFDGLEKESAKILTFSDPEPHGDNMVIHGLIYRLEPIEGWVEVKILCIYRPPDKNIVADRAWVDPNTIDTAYLQDYKHLGREDGHKPPPIAWGFGPKTNIGKYKYERASFVFVNPHDWLWLEEKYLRPKREELCVEGRE